MNRPAATTAPASTCQIRVAGHLDEHWSAWLGGFALTRGDDGTTVITGPVTDQAQLHGVLARVRDLGVPLISLLRVEISDPDAGTPSSTPPAEPSAAPPATSTTQRRSQP